MVNTGYLKDVLILIKSLAVCIVLVMHKTSKVTESQRRFQAKQCHGSFILVIKIHLIKISAI